MNNRLTNKEALDLILNKPLIELGEMAYAKKLEKHPENVTTFIVDRNINYTNV